MGRIDDIRRACSEDAVHCFGTHYVFGERARILRRRLRFLTFLGLALPASAGTAYMTYGHDSIPAKLSLWAAGALGVLQVVASVWSLTSRWEDDFAYALESLSSNRSLFQKYRTLADSPPSDQAEAELALRLSRRKMSSERPSTRNRPSPRKRSEWECAQPCANCKWSVSVVRSFQNR